MVTTVPAGSPQHPGRPPSREPLARELRWELMHEEGRALASSYAASIMLALVWVLLVRLTPAPVAEPLAPAIPIVWKGPVPRQPTVYAPAAKHPDRVGAPARRVRDAGATVADAFRRGAGTVVDALGALRDVAVARGGETPAAMAGKIVLDVGQGGVGSRRPGRDPIGNPAGVARGAGIAEVGSGAGVARAGAEVSLPPVVVAPPAAAGARSASELGVTVRARAAQLQSCYEREGRSRNADLAGTVVVRMIIAGNGDVADVQIARRSWAGVGAAETEECIRSVVRTWRFPAAAEAVGTYTFPVSFTAAK